jgi:hypothetical protein
VDSLVSDDSMADAACSTSSVVSILANSRTRASAHFVSVSSCGAYRVPRYEGRKLSTLLTVQGGYQLVIYGVKKDGQVLPTPIPNDGDPWSVYDGYCLFAVVLGPGCTLYVCSSVYFLAVLNIFTVSLLQGHLVPSLLSRLAATDSNRVSGLEVASLVDQPSFNLFMVRSVTRSGRLGAQTRIMMSGTSTLPSC